MDNTSNTRHVVDVGHTKVSYSLTPSAEERGEGGPSLLFVHGWPLNGHTWRNVTQHLDGFTRYVIDLPGAGESKVTPQTPLTIRGLVDAVVSMIDALGLDNVVLVGQNSGGMICRFAAEKRPEAVQALALCNTEIPGDHPQLVTMYKNMAKLPGAKAAFRMNMGTRLLAKGPLVLGGTMYDKSLLDGEFRTELLDPILNDDDAMDAAVELIKSWSNDDVDSLAETHQNLTMPTLLVWGEEDPFFPVEKARAMVEQFGGPTEFVTVPKCKLFLHEEHPKRFADLTRDFLSRHIQVG